MLLWGSKSTSALAIVFINFVLMSYTAPSHAQYRANGDDLALLFCSYVQANDSTGFRNALRDLRLRLRDIYPRVRCNGSSMIQFSASSNAYDIGRFIAHSVLIDDLYSSGDIAWVKNQEPTHPIAEVVRARSQAARSER